MSSTVPNTGISPLVRLVDRLDQAARLIEQTHTMCLALGGALESYDPERDPLSEQSRGLGYMASTIGAQLAAQQAEIEAVSKLLLQAAQQGAGR